MNTSRSHGICPPRVPRGLPMSASGIGSQFQRQGTFSLDPEPSR